MPQQVADTLDDPMQQHEEDDFSDDESDESEEEMFDALNDVVQGRFDHTPAADIPMDDPPSLYDLARQQHLMTDTPCGALTYEYVFRRADGRKMLRARYDDRFRLPCYIIFDLDLEKLKEQIEGLEEDFHETSEIDYDE